MRVAIMQPTYLPWCGYFAMMEAVDVFIFLDSVQFAKRSWQQRNQIKTKQGPLWLSVPVTSKGRSDQRIYEVELDNSSNFAINHPKTIKGNYAKAAYFEQLGPMLIDCIAQPRTLLAELNISIIAHCRDVLGISTPLLRASNMHGRGIKADLLASLCKEVGATEYISAPGSKDYLEKSSAFDELGIAVSYFNYRHPHYPQLFGDFIPYMSVIDMLLNCGSESLKIIRTGIDTHTRDVGSIYPV